jgi:hypothetical protein
MKHTTDPEEKNRIESEIREIISNIVRKWLKERMF